MAPMTKRQLEIVRRLSAPSYCKKLSAIIGRTVVLSDLMPLDETYAVLDAMTPAYKDPIVFEFDRELLRGEAECRLFDALDAISDGFVYIVLNETRDVGLLPPIAVSICRQMFFSWYELDVDLSLVSQQLRSGLQIDLYSIDIRCADGTNTCRAALIECSGEAWESQGIPDFLRERFPEGLL